MFRTVNILLLDVCKNGSQKFLVFRCLITYSPLKLMLNKIKYYKGKVLNMAGNLQQIIETTTELKNDKK